MGTKLKSIKYSIVTKVIAAILAWISLISACGSCVYLLTTDVVSSSSYYDSYNFISEYSRLIHDTVEYFIKLKSEENIKAAGVNEADIQEKLNRYHIIKNSLSKQVNFAYYIRDTSTGEVITNRYSKDCVGLFEKQESMVHLGQDKDNNGYGLMHYSDIEEILEGTSYEVYAAVIEPIKEGDVLYDNYVSYTKSKTLANSISILFFVSLIFMLLTLAYLVFAAGRKAGLKEVALTCVDRIYLDIHSLFVFIVAIISILNVDLTFYSITMGELIIFSIDFFIGLSYLLSITRQVKAKRIKKNLFVYKVYREMLSFINLLFEGKIFKAWILLLLAAYSAINSILFTLAYLAFIHNDSKIVFIILVLMVPFNIVVLYMTAKSLKSLPKIMEAAKEISAGNLDYKLDSSEMSIAFSAFAQNIQSIQGGLKKAVDDAIKGERMKTDLITNVSHDLKTPLTSIINYVDLLKKEPTENQKVHEYIEVLDEKSARLKVLIEDLIEASKASSGNLTVNTQKVDLHELVMQAFGEYREKFEKSGLDIRINTTDKNIFVQADGKHMWRIIENLLSNVLKYSMKNSRVYVSITKTDDYGVLTIKNISQLPLDIPVEQLTERFVRGDISRTTEGSGLGLSIAQSLTNMQKGRFIIEIDGDLFKAMVEIPLWI